MANQNNMLIIAGKTVQQNYRRMRACAIGQVHNTVQPISVTLEINFHDGGGLAAPMDFGSSETGS